jgi:hypothetical protein
LDAVLYGTGKTVKESGRLTKEEAEELNTELEKALEDGK